MKKSIVIIGAGIIGSCIARELARYDLNISVLEKENDVCEGTSCANSAIVHSGYDPYPSTLMAKLNVEGNKMFDELQSELGFEFKRNGSLTLANSIEEVQVLDELLKRAKANGVEARIVEQEELRKMEPNVTAKACAALYCPTAGIVDPFNFNISVMENAMQNGVKLYLEHQVLNIEKAHNQYVVETNHGKFMADIVINSAGVYADIVAKMVGIDKYELKYRKGEYYLLDHFDDNFIKHTLFNVPTNKGKGILVAPTTSYNYLVGPSSEFVDDASDLATDDETLKNIKLKAKDLVDKIDYSKQIKEFSGIRAVGAVHDFVISEDLPSFINLIGIQSPGLTAAPAIAKYVVKMLPKFEVNKNFNPHLPKYVHLKDLDDETRNELIKKNPEYGWIICRCEQISKGEVLDAIRRPLGAKSIKGVKKRVRAGFGKCQGGFCEEIVLNILAKELKLSPYDIPMGRKESYILKNFLGDKDA